MAIWRGERFANSIKISHNSSHQDVKSNVDNVKDKLTAHSESNIAGDRERRIIVDNRVAGFREIDTKKPYGKDVYRPSFIPKNGVSVQQAFNVALPDRPSQVLTLQFEMPNGKSHRGHKSIAAVAQQVSSFLSQGPGSKGFTHTSFYNAKTWLAHYADPVSVRAAVGRRVVAGVKGDTIEIQQYRASSPQYPYSGAKFFLCHNVPDNIDAATIAFELLASFPDSNLQFKLPAPVSPDEANRSLESAYAMTFQFDCKTDIETLFCRVPGFGANFNCEATMKKRKNSCLICKGRGHRFFECAKMQTMKLQHPRARA